jgi:hypothetical protein
MAVVAAVAALSTIVLGGSCGRVGGGDPQAPRGGGAVPAARAAAPVLADRGDGSGPSSYDGIVPVGFSHNEAGAAAAANAYFATLQRLVFSDRKVREAALRRMAASSASDVVDGGLAALRAVDAVLEDARRQHSDAGAFLKEIPVAYRVQSAGGGTEAQVDVWSLAVFLVEGRTEATEVWSTNSVGLVWEAGDWRVAWWVRASGPVPAATREAPTPSEAVLRAVAGWKGFQHAPES